MKSIVSLKCLGMAALAALLSTSLGSVQAEDLIAYEVVDETGIDKSLTGAPGDPDKGREVFVNRKLGNCLGCHVVSELDGELFHGEVGPPLDGVADRYEEGELRLRVVNAKLANPDTVMPGFYEVASLHRVAPDFAGKPILTAEQVEDIVAYLMTLTEG